MPLQVYSTVVTERIDDVWVCRLSDGALVSPESVLVIDLETGAAPVDETGRQRAAFAASATHLEIFDYDAPVTGDEFPTRHVAGRYAIIALEAAHAPTEVKG